MKLKFLLLSILFFSSGVYSFADDIGKGENGLGGGTDISSRMLFSTRPAITIDVSILDANTEVEIDIVSVEELDNAIDRLAPGEYLLIYTDGNGNVIEQTFILKE